MNHFIQAKESQLEYQIRLCENKEVYDLSWRDIAGLMAEVTGDEKSPDYFRKWWEPFAQGRQYEREKIIDNDEIIAKLEEKEQKISIEKKKLAAERTVMNANQRIEARMQEIHDMMRLEIQSLQRVKPLVFDPVEVTMRNVEYREGVVLFSDWHSGLSANNHWNQFDDGILKQRVRMFVQKSIAYGVENGIRVLHVFNLGDYIQGLIHLSGRINATNDVIRQTMMVSEVLADTIAEYANNFESIYLYFCRGNHDRVNANRNEEIANESFFDIVPWFLKERLRDFENVNFMKNKYDDEIISAKICNSLCVGVHGHRDSTASMVQNLSLMTKEVPDYIFSGHIHHHYEDEIHGVEIVVNSCLSGVDSYAKEIRKTSKPAQKFMVFNNVGRLCTYNILL